MAEQFKMPSAPSSSRPSSKTVSTGLSVIAEDASGASCSSTSTGVCLSSTVTDGSNQWHKYGYEGVHGNEYPRRRSDGKWVIAYDEDNWEDVVVDDIEGMDPSQFQTRGAREKDGKVIDLVTTDYVDGVVTCTAIVPFDETAQCGSDSQRFFGSSAGFSRPSSPVRPSQNMEWPSSLPWNSFSEESKGSMSEILPGVVGLNNLGNTCFINSGLQCLFNTPSFLDLILLKDPDSSPLHPRAGELNNSLGSCFISLFNKVWSKSRTEMVIKPAEFKDALGQHHLQFQDYRQHDCQEFLALLLGTLHDQFNRATPVPAQAPLVPVSSRCDEEEEETAIPGDTNEPCPVESTCATDSPKSCDSSSVSSSSSTASEADQTSAISSLRNQPLPPNVQPFLVPDLPALVSGDHHGQPLSMMESNIIPIERLSSSSTGNVSSSSTSCPTVGTNSGNLRTMGANSGNLRALGTVSGNLRALGTVSGNRSRASSQSNEMISNEVSRGCGQEKNEIYDYTRRRIESDSMVDSSGRLSSEMDDRGEEEEPSSSTTETAVPFQGPITVEDLEKDMKIPNSNLLMDSINTNNKIMFDSAKYPRFRDNLRNQGIVDNFRGPFVGVDEMMVGDEQLKDKSLKRSKSVNVVNGKIMDITSCIASTLSPGMSNSSGSMKSHLSPVTVYASNNKKKKLEDVPTASVSSIEEPMEILEQPAIDGHSVNGHEMDEQVEDDGDVAWNEYLNKNQSVIVDTFQGQFKSTVRCFTCDHVSVTFEPFMYLPVPLPHALEKQVVITFISCSTTSFGSHGSPPKQYLINIHKFDRLSKVVTEFKKILDEERSSEASIHESESVGCDREVKLVVAEVKSNHVVRILEDYLSVKFVDEKNLFIFQLLASKSRQVVPSLEPFHGPWMPDTTCLGTGMDDAIVPDGSASGMVTSSDGVEGNLIVNEDSDLEHLRPNLDRKSPTLSPMKPDTHSSLMDEFEKPDTHSSLMDDFEKPDTHSSLMDDFEGSNPQHYSTVESWNTDFGNVDSSTTEGVPSQKGTEGSSDDHQLSTCIVCLDAKSKSELLQHLGCNCIICSECLDRHSSINAIESSDQFLCPTCQSKLTKVSYATLDKPPPQIGPFTTVIPIVFRVPKDSSDENSTNEKKTVTFDEIANSPTGSSASKNRRESRGKPSDELTSTVTNRRESWGKPSDELTSTVTNRSNKKLYDLITYPVLVDVPKSTTCNNLYKLIDPFVPFPFPYSLHYVKPDGQSCCRCDSWSSPECTGCEIYRSSSSMFIMPSDVIAVEFDPISIGDYSIEVPSIVPHESMNQKRSQEPLTLIDCIKAFHESEILDSDNPWYCPSCCSNQRANKTLSIWKSPKTLMVYLKRFLFHEMQPNKVDDTVTFPIDRLDMGQFIRKRTKMTALNNVASCLKDQEEDTGGLYTLQSFVCHSGGVSAGHYTAFAKHAVTGKWYFFNDSSVSVQEPVPSDDRAYILFYDRIDPDHEENITRRLCLMDKGIDLPMEGSEQSEQRVKVEENGQIVKLQDAAKKCGQVDGQKKSDGEKSEDEKNAENLGGKELKVEK